MSEIYSKDFISEEESCDGCSCDAFLKFEVEEEAERGDDVAEIVTKSKSIKVLFQATIMAQSASICLSKQIPDSHQIAEFFLTAIWSDLRD